MVDAPKAHVGVAWDLAILLHDTGHHNQALHLRRYLVEHLRQCGDTHRLSGAHGNQAMILRDLGDLDEALILLREQERICRQQGNRQGLANTLGNQALIVQDSGDLDGALALYQQGEAIYRELGDRDGLARSLGNQGTVMRTHGDLDRALLLFQEKERICRELGNRDGLASTVGNVIGHKGRWHEPATGLIENRARTNNPRIGRWMQRDLRGSTSGVNTYVFLATNPIGSWDPLGRFIRGSSIIVADEIGGSEPLSRVAPDPCISGCEAEHNYWIAYCSLYFPDLEAWCKCLGCCYGASNACMVTCTPWGHDAFPQCDSDDNPNDGITQCDKARNPYNCARSYYDCVHDACD